MTSAYNNGATLDALPSSLYTTISTAPTTTITTGASTVQNQGMADMGVPAPGIAPLARLAAVRVRTVAAHPSSTASTSSSSSATYTPARSRVMSDNDFAAFRSPPSHGSIVDKEMKAMFDQYVTNANDSPLTKAMKQSQWSSYSPFRPTTSHAHLSNTHGIIPEVSPRSELRRVDPQVVAAELRAQIDAGIVMPTMDATTRLALLNSISPLSSRAEANRAAAAAIGPKLSPLSLLTSPSMTNVNGNATGRPTTPAAGPATARPISPAATARGGPRTPGRPATTQNGNNSVTPLTRLSTSSSRQSLMSRSSSRKSMMTASSSRSSLRGRPGSRRGGSPAKKPPPVRAITPVPPPVVEPPTIGMLLHPSIHAPRPPPSSDSSPSESPPESPTSAGLNALLAQHAAANGTAIPPTSPGGGGGNNTNTANNNNTNTHGAGHHPLSPSSSHATLISSPSSSSIGHNNTFPRPVSPGNLSVTGGNPSSARRRSQGGGRVTLNVPGAGDGSESTASLLGVSGMSTSSSIMSLGSTTSSIPLPTDRYTDEMKRLHEWEEWSAADVVRIREKFTARGLPFPEASVRKMLSPPEDMLLEQEKKQLFPLIEQRLAEGDPTRYHVKRVRTMEVLTLPEIEPDLPELKWAGPPWTFRSVQKIRNPKRQALFKLDWQAMKLTDLITNPQQEEELKRVIYPYYDILRRAYLYQTSGSGQLGYLSQLQFHRFCTAAHIIDPIVTSRFVDQLFVKINGVGIAEAAAAAALAANGGTKSVVGGSPPATMATPGSRRRSGRTLAAAGASPIASRPTTAGREKASKLVGDGTLTNVNNTLLSAASGKTAGASGSASPVVDYVEELSDDEVHVNEAEEKEIKTHNIVGGTLVSFSSPGHAGRVASAKLKELQKSHQASDNENQFSRHEFIEALIRIADAKYSRYEPRPDLTYRVHRLLEKHVRGMASHSLITRTRTKLLTPACQEVFKNRGKKLYSLFCKVAGSEEGSAASLSPKELENMLRDYALIDKTLSRRVTLSAYALSLDENDGGGLHSGDMRYPSFLEFIARLAHIKFTNTDLDLAERIDKMCIILENKPRVRAMGS